MLKLGQNTTVFTTALRKSAMGFLIMRKIQDLSIGSHPKK